MKYSTCDLTYNVSYRVKAAKVQNASNTVNDVSACISLL